MTRTDRELAEAYWNDDEPIDPKLVALFAEARAAGRAEGEAERARLRRALTRVIESAPACTCVVPVARAALAAAQAEKEGA